MEKFLTISDIQQILHKSRNTVLRLLPEMNPIDTSASPKRHQYLVRESELERWLASRTNPVCASIEKPARKTRRIADNEYADEYGRSLRKKNGQFIPLTKPPKGVQQNA